MFDAFVRDFADHLAGYGFERDKGTRDFRRVSPAGDTLVVDLQLSRSSSRRTKVFYINVALVLAAQWESYRRRKGLPASALPRSVHGIWHSRIGEQWQTGDRATLATVSVQVRRHLDRTLPELLGLLDRDTLFVDAADRFKAIAWPIRAWLLAEEGPSADLDHLVSQLNGDRAEWIREYSRSRSRPRQELESRTVQGWIAEDDVLPLMKRISRFIAYEFDDLDEVALTGAFDHTEALFRYPLMGIPPVTVSMARPASGADISVHLDGPMKPMLADRLGGLLRHPADH